MIKTIWSTKIDIRAVAYNNNKEFGQFAFLPALFLDRKIRGIGRSKPKINKVYIISFAFLIFRAEVSLEVYS